MKFRHWFTNPLCPKCHNIMHDTNISSERHSECSNSECELFGKKYATPHYDFDLIEVKKP